MNLEKHLNYRLKDLQKDLIYFEEEERYAQRKKKATLEKIEKIKNQLKAKGINK